MTMYLTTEEAAALDTQIARVEARTGVQIVTAVVGKSDTYVELPWKAFALGASLAALAVILNDALRPGWNTAGTSLLHAIAILGTGAACALLAIFFPPFARLLLRPHRADLEVSQHAQSLFLRRELFKTRQRTAVLVLVSLFERRIEILPDVGLHDRISETDWHGVIARMAPLLRQRSPGRALQECLAAVETLLADRGFQASGAVVNELSDQPIEERGV